MKINKRKIRDHLWQLGGITTLKGKLRLKVSNQLVISKCEEVKMSVDLILLRADITRAGDNGCSEVGHQLM